MQGWRISMEDAHTAELNLPAPDNDTKTHPDRLAFFGVYDGHGGDKVALFAGDNIHNIVFKQDSFKTGNYAQGLKDGFLATDRAILNGTIMIPHFICICRLVRKAYAQEEAREKQSRTNIGYFKTSAASLAHMLKS